MAAISDILRLQDKTAVITHPRTAMARAITTKLAEQGVDIALLGPPDKESERFAEQISNHREISDQHGRCVFVGVDFKVKKEVEDAIARCAEALGAIDMLIDTSMTSLTGTFSADGALNHLDTMIDLNLRVPLILTHRLMKFCKGRKKGRIIYLVPDLVRAGLEEEALLAGTRTSLIHFAKVLARETAADNVTVNCLAVGATEEFLLARFPLSKSIQGAQEELAKRFPGWKPSDPGDVANAVVWLASPLSNAVTGQVVTASGLP